MDNNSVVITRLSPKDIYKTNNNVVVYDKSVRKLHSMNPFVSWELYPYIIHHEDGNWHKDGWVWSWKHGTLSKDSKDLWTGEKSGSKSLSMSTVFIPSGGNNPSNYTKYNVLLSNPSLNINIVFSDVTMMKTLGEYILAFMQHGLYIYKIGDNEHSYSSDGPVTDIQVMSDTCIKIDDEYLYLDTWTESDEFVVLETDDAICVRNIQNHLIIRKKPKEKECYVCFETVKNKVMLLPCMHTGMCVECARKVDKCPLCRADIVERMGAL